MNDTIRAKLELLPSSPGVYKMFDARGDVIYVGKAISLKNRVRQYFGTQKHRPPKVAAMVSHIADFETILASSETEALTLESNLIKSFQPRYNILLKDDKHFPYVRIDLRQRFPRAQIVRRLSDDGAKYLGPYLSSHALYAALNIVSEHFPVRHCKKDIERAIARRERPCLMYHLGKCIGPCSGNISRDEYHALIGNVMDFLNGDTAKVIAKLTQDMEQASMKLEFERAARFRDSIQAIRMMGEKQTAIANKGVERDAFACCSYNDDMLVFGVFVRGGKVVGTERFPFARLAADMGDTQAARAEVMSAFLKQYYNDAISIPPDILLYEAANEQDTIQEWLTSKRNRRVKLTVPERGEKRALTELAHRNCMDQLINADILKKRAWERGEGALSALSVALELDCLPSRLECFDNSHIQGRDTVSSMVVFIGGAPAKKEYRRFRIKSQTDGDDIAAMREALSRRFKRAMDGDDKYSSLPDLLILDGGRAQLNVALEVLREYGLEHIPTIALAEFSNQVYLPDRDEPLSLDRDSPEQHLLERIRDEAHRFAIAYHRGLRSKNSLYSRLDGIQGVGDKRKRILFDNFLTIDAISKASEDELLAIKGIDKKTAKAVYEYFHAGE